jgi:hypothetical protein
MVARLPFVLALAVLLGPAWASSARADDCDDAKAAVEQYLKDQYGTTDGYSLHCVTDAFVGRVFPNLEFVEVIFRQYPIAVLSPPGLSPSDVFVVQNGAVVDALTSPANLEDFFFNNLKPVGDEDQADDAGLTWLRLSYVFSQDGFYTFGDPDVSATTFADGSIEVTGGVQVTAGGKGHVRATLDFDSNGDLKDVSEVRRVCPGVRPICQATKLLDRDPLVRQMAEQDILVMGKAAKGYLDEQRAKARPELQKAIDRIWKRIVDEES